MDFVLIDGSYFIFYRYHALRIWWGLAKKEEETRLVSEGACVRALEALGFEAFYGGDADEEWVAQVGGKQT